ncbi:telomeric repeat binding factor a [Chanos chanos]|uniref:Telomeric repeat binding factor a n=1 Tax=Chanos chanos TaxID=29144 RepID=A0A6J2VL60_CHACN|nr:telomeric repeat-binding factor 2-like [Chanos chanos]
MATSKYSGLKRLADEKIINRWNLEFYIYTALDVFRDGDYAAFCQIRSIIDSLTVRPIDGNGDLIVKLLFTQFLSRINDGDKLDRTFQNTLLPLESALLVLDRIGEEVDVQQQDIERVRNSIKEMLVILCIRSKEFNKASDMLLKHFNKGLDCGREVTFFTSLIQRKCSSHPRLDKISYEDFKQDMLDFIERLHTIPEPFLIKNVRKFRDVRAENLQTSTKDGASQELQNNQRSTPMPRSSTDSEQLSVSMLRKVYMVLAEKQGVAIPFSQLLDEVEKEAEEESGNPYSQELVLQLSESPLEELEVAENHLEEEPHEQQNTAQHLLRPSTSDQCTDTSALNTDLDSSMETAVEHISESPKSTPAESLSADPLQDKSTDPDPHQASMQHDAGSRSDISVQSQSIDPDMQAESVCAVEVCPEDVACLKSVSVTVPRLVMEDDSHTSESEFVSPHQPSTPVRQESVGLDPLSSLPTVSPPVRTLRNRAAKSPRRQTDSHSESEERENVTMDSPLSDQPSTPVRQESAGLDPLSSLPTVSTPVRTLRNRAAKSPRCHTDGHTESEERENVEMDSQLSDKPSTPRRIKRGRWMNVPGTKEDWSDEDSLFSSADSKGIRNGDSQGKRKRWSQQETEWIREGVRRYGAGRWEKIKSSFPFQGRSAVNIKDRWRTMVRQRIA